MADIQVIVNSLIARARQTDPVMLDILRTITDELARIGVVVDPAPDVERKSTTLTGPPPDAVSVFGFALTKTNVVLSWEAPNESALRYEIRRGTVWEDAFKLLITGNLSAVLDPIEVGTTTYLIKSISSSGIRSISSISIEVQVPALGLVDITSRILENQVLLNWDEPLSTFRISHYIIRRENAVLVSHNVNTFWAYNEIAAGRYTYSVSTVDIVGNESLSVSVPLTVSNPTDFEIEDEITSVFSGTISNGIVGDDGKLYINVDTAKTYEDHFTDNSWSSPQDQVDDDYDLWIQPTLLMGYYEEVFEFGQVLNNVTVNLSWLFEIVKGSFSFGLDIRISDDDVTYSTPFTEAVFFATSARYIKAKITFTSGSDEDLLAFSNFNCSLSIKREQDGDKANVLASDHPSGTTVMFNKPFLSVESITVTPEGIAEITAGYDYSGGLTFKILAFAANGDPVNATVSWQARGIL